MTAADAGPQDALRAIGGVEGWLTHAQARRLFAAVRDIASPAPVVVEIGSFRGRSAIVLAHALPDGAPPVVCIDPHLGSDRGPQEYAPDAALGEADLAALHANLAAAGVAERVRHVRALSSDAAAQDAVSSPVDVLYVDGAHRFGPARGDLREWGARVAPGGRLLVHDAFSSVGVTLAILVEQTGAAGWRYRGRDGSLAEWERRDAPAPSVGARVADAARVLAQLPWFARNVVVKALILARLRPLARLLGHGPHDGPWPY